MRVALFESNAGPAAASRSYGPNGSRAADDPYASTVGPDNPFAPADRSDNFRTAAALHATPTALGTPV
jgi:hypothetical protein